MRPEPLRVVVAGMVAGVPDQGGAAWAVLQWVLGLRSLGHDVLLVEPVEELTDGTARYLRAVASAFDLHERAALVTGAGGAHGVGRRTVADFCERADVVFDLAGMLAGSPLLASAPVRVYVDLDPAFTQLWQAEGIDMGFADHTHFATVGLDVGAEDNPIPTCGLAWIPTLPPVALDHWEADGPHGSDWTTVAHWRGYGSVWSGGLRHGQKAHSWRGVLDLPRRTDAQLRPAIAIHADEEADIAALRSHGWSWHDPGDVAATPEAYRSFVLASCGELGIAKEGYVVSRSGWFSDRSACYLAAGRPVIAQDTGFPAHLPTGMGLLAFGDAAQAAEALARVRADYDRHAAAARSLARELLDARVVLRGLLDRVGVAA